jgi:ATP-dependent DNA ligase
MRPSFIEPMLPPWSSNLQRAMTGRYAPPVVTAACELPARSAIIDGEMVVLDSAGKSSYHGFRKAIKGSPGRLVLIAFDLLTLDGKDVRGETALENFEDQHIRQTGKTVA